MDGSYVEEIINIISANKDNIKYLGAITHMVDFYNGCDIIVNNSNEAGSEPLGTTIYEAMACEKLVIASVTGGSTEIIADKNDGLTFEVDDNKSLYEVLRYAILNSAELTYIKKNARIKVINGFNITNMAEQYNKILAADF